MSNLKTLADRLLAFERALNDGADVYAGDALKHGKGLEKARKGRSNLAVDNEEDPLVVVDSTVWGSVEEGIYITENYIHGKELFEDLHTFSVDTIHTIQIEDDNRSIMINNVSIKWLSDNVTPKMKIVAQCLQEQIDSRINATSSVQEGFSAYLKKLDSQLYVLQTTTWRWGIDFSMKISSVTGDMYEYAPFGEESFLRRVAIAARRTGALGKYSSMRSEAEAKIHALKESVPVKHANDLFRQYEVEEIDFSFDFGPGPDRNTEISNEDWQSNTQEAFDRLQECSKSLENKIEEFMAKLAAIREEECDDD